MLSFTSKAITKDLLANLPERSRKVLIHRFGLGTSNERRTLDAIGKEYGITRERIRQIENHGLGAIRDSGAYTNHTESLEELQQVIRELGGILPEHVILKEIPKNESERNHLVFLLTVGRPFVYKRETDHFHPRWHVDGTLADTIERALIRLHDDIDPEHLIPQSEFLALFVRYIKEEGARAPEENVLLRWLGISKKVGVNPLGEWGRVESPHVRIRNTRDFAYLTLKRHGSPMHFVEVAQGIEKLFGREAHPATTHNELIKDGRFVLVGRGLYALKEWGYAPGIVREVIKNILESEGPLSRQDIIERVKRERYVKDATVLVNLQSGAFARTPDGRYTIV